ncbi:hypothetical protein JRQ81_012146 [Phrynocephalus forsythii]|uniref:Uncharacterized protein n=1 Tax=Phrynocephalus forsythii TaxID=171643 RepID=A0A9Q1APS5_9SAUR|nr:hypothetical protein JRQ81_012146 [Phrynocephalus forsythii]
MAAEPGVSAGLGLRFQSAMEDVVPPPIGREDPSWEGPCKTRPGNNSRDNEGPPRHNGDLSERLPALNPSSGSAQPLIPVLWDNPRWLMASTEKVVYEEVPENHLEAEPAPSEAGQKAILAEVKQEIKVIADRVGDAPSTETGSRAWEVERWWSLE